MLNKLPKILHTQANKGLRETWMFPTKKDADAVFNNYLKVYGIKYPKVAHCLEKDRCVAKLL